MAESSKSSVKSTAKKNKCEKPISASFSQCSTTYGTVNSGRLSLLANTRIQKLASSSSERLSFVSEDDIDEIENYRLEYSKYLLRKAQNRILSANKKVKEGNIKKYLVSLKLEFQELLDKFVKLNEEVEYLLTYFDVLTRINMKIEKGAEVLKLLRETEFDSLMRTLSGVLDYTINQLQLVDIDKSLIDDAFRKKIWGSGSEIEMCLKKIESFLSKDKVEVSKIAGELVEIQKLALENAMMRERFNSLFNAVSSEIAETNYELFTGTVKKAFEQRERSKTDKLTYFLDCDIEFLHPDLKPTSSEHFRLSFLDLEDFYPLLPNSSSTPQQDKKA